MTQPMSARELLRSPLDLPEMPYDHLLRAAAEQHPDRPAIISNQQALTYRDVVLMVNRVANDLRGLGIGADFRQRLPLQQRAHVRPELSPGSRRYRSSPANCPFVPAQEEPG